MIRAAAILALAAAPAAAPAAAETRQIMLSHVTLAPSLLPGAAADLTFRNSDADGPRRLAETFDLRLGDLTVTVDVIVGGAVSDTVAVTVPSGFIAVPAELSVIDGQTGRLSIFPLSAVGL